MVTLIDAVILTGSGLLGGIATGLAIRNKQIKNLQEEVDAADRSYMNLLDKYMELFSSHKNLISARSKTIRRGPGRPKGSKNKTNQDGKPTTRKYTRKSSK
jgi:hypothetical protein